MDVDSIVGALAGDDLVYACGPRRLLEAVRAAADRAGLLPRQVRIESCGAACLPTDRPVTLELAAGGTTVAVAADTTLLDALLEVGVWAPHECRRGECGACAVEVLGGEPDHRDVCLTADQRRTLVCTCVSRARSARLRLAL